VPDDEVRNTLKRMKKGKAQRPDEIPVEAWICLGEICIEFLTELFNRLLHREKMPEEWRRSLLMPFYKNKGGIRECGNYQGTKLMSHTVKRWERMLETRLRKEVVIGNEQFGFMPGRSTTEAIFSLRMLREKWR